MDAIIHERETEIEQLEAKEVQQRKLESNRRKDAKQKLQAWKEEKFKEEEELRKREQAKKEAEMLRQEEAERKRKDNQAELLEQYKKLKEQKKAEEKDVLVRELSRSPRPPSPRDVERVKEREHQHLSRQLDLKTKKIREKQERQERIDKMANQVRVTVDRDFGRVTRATEAYKNRIAEQQETESDNSPRHLNFDVRHVQHLATPSWRKGL
jgi:hypothetical protein